MLYINYIKGPSEKNLKKSLLLQEKSQKVTLDVRLSPVCSTFAASDPTCVTKGWVPVAVPLHHLIQVSQSRLGASCGIFPPSDPSVTE